MMAAFGPGVGKKDKYPGNARVRQPGKKKSGVITEYSDIGKIALVHLGQQSRHAIEVGLATDNPDIGVGPRLPCQMFASTKSYLEPIGVIGGKELRPWCDELAWIGVNDLDRGKEVVHEHLTVQPQRAPHTTTVKNTLDVSLAVVALVWAWIDFRHEPPARRYNRWIRRRRF
jgi:hypothetical protein